MAPGTAVGSRKFKRCGEKKAVVWWGKKLSWCFRDTNPGCWAGCGDVPWGRPGVARDTNLRWEVSELGVKLLLWSTEGYDFCVALTLDRVLTGRSGPFTAGTRLSSENFAAQRHCLRDGKVVTVSEKLDWILHFYCRTFWKKMFFKDERNSHL